MQLIELVPVFLQIFCCCLTRAAASPEVKRHWHNSRVCTSSASGDTCDSPSPFISNLNGYPPELPRASSTILGRIPERVSVIPSASDVFVSIKATASYHEARLSLLLLTWMQTLHSNQVYIVTDVGEDYWTKFARNEGFHVVKANCPIGHNRAGLCCKSGVEYEQYFSALERNEKYRWFCHFDDDIYVNIPALAELLSQFNATEEVYLGRWSLNKKEKIELQGSRIEAFPEKKHSNFYFATGAAYCISSVLMTEVEPYLRGKAFEETGEKLRLTDDMVIGFVIDAILGYNLTVVPAMNSHLNSLRSIRPKNLKSQVTISYGKFTSTNRPVTQNRVSIPDATFTEEEDSTRFLSYHCLLYPDTSWCKN